MYIINKNNLILIEDCAQRHGAYYNNKRLGSFGLLTTHSFYSGKNLGAFGDGGAICTSNYELYHKLQKMRNNILSLQMFPDLTREEITNVCDRIKDFYALECPL